MKLFSQLRTRRIATLLLAIVVAVPLVYAIARLAAFAQLFGIFKPHSGVRITQVDIAQGHVGEKEPVVPKILHQIFHNWKDPGNDTLPSHWAAARQSCVNLNPDWEFKLWTTDISRTFIEDEFSWFLPTYDGYKFPIQRIDVLRYFLLLHYGGIYIDLDNGCAESLNPITYIPAFTTDGGKGALSNNIIGGQPGHPFFRLLTEYLVPYNWNWILPYIIISYGSGQWFVTDMWEKYHYLLSKDGTVRGYEDAGAKFRPLHHILMAEGPGSDPWVFFTQTRGGTWTNWDSAMFGWVGDHIILIVAGVAAIVGLLIWSCVWCIRRRNAFKGYQALPRVEG